MYKSNGILLFSYEISKKFQWTNERKIVEKKASNKTRKGKVKWNVYKKMTKASEVSLWNITLSGAVVTISQIN